MEISLSELKPRDHLSLLRLPSDDLFGGLAALVIGAVFFGAIPLWKARYESIGFVLVGALLSVTFGAVYLLILGVAPKKRIDLTNCKICKT